MRRPFCPLSDRTSSSCARRIPPAYIHALNVIRCAAPCSDGFFGSNTEGRYHCTHIHIAARERNEDGVPARVQIPHLVGGLHDHHETRARAVGGEHLAVRRWTASSIMRPRADTQPLSPLRYLPSCRVSLTCKCREVVGNRNERSMGFDCRIDIRASANERFRENFERGEAGESQNHRSGSSC